MNSDLIDYRLPPELIAQEPTERRDASRLLVLDRQRDTIEHRRFHEITDYLVSGDVLVVNDTRVIPARLRGHRQTGGAVEMLLLEEDRERPGVWSVLLRPGKAGREGNQLRLDGKKNVSARTVGRHGNMFFVEFRENDRKLDKDKVIELCEEIGETPVPPYIKRASNDERLSRDRERYQTVYAAPSGAVAAPTAGLHFTDDLLTRLEAQGVQRFAITLHVSFDSFKPLTQETLQSGKLHGEWVDISRDTAESLCEVRRNGRRIVSVGTTSARALESFGRAGNELPYRERTTLFIRPGHQFRMMDALITNFHLPRSSLLLLVSAFAGRDRILQAYEEAKKQGYRFYSYGDAMLIV